MHECSHVDVSANEPLDVSNFGNVRKEMVKQTMHKIKCETKDFNHEEKSQSDG